jgi:homoserine O-acetyltransferase
MVGPGKAINTDSYFVICSNIIGGCSGTTGPGSINPATGRPYGLDFPMVTISDMVKVQKLLLDKLAVKQVLCVVGGSMGGMQSLQWAVSYPEFVRSAVVIAATTHLGAQAIAFDAVGRNAIIADPRFANGKYASEQVPERGLGIARMIGHITYLSEQSMREKFGRQLRGAEGYRYDFDSEFAVETYLDHQGRSFVGRFDANSYLYITKAMDYFDLKREYGSLSEAFARVKARFLIVSFSSDWLFTPEQSEDMVNALVANGKDVSYCNIDCPYGHDSFLLESGKLAMFLEGFIAATRRPQQVVAEPLQRASVGAGALGGWARRVDYELIESLIEPRSTVLDVGCGDGYLLARLTVDKKIQGKGIELDQDLVIKCVERGLSVIQHDVERGLGYADKSFDVVTLSQTVQTVKDPEKVFRELLRVGKRVIVSFPNFAHWRCRAQLLLSGRAPVTEQLPHEWHRSPNIHWLSIRDFDRFCARLGVRVEKRIPLIKTSVSPVRFAPNFFAEQVIYVTSKD